MASDTGGVKPFSIQGRLARERERLLGMSDKERAWRRQWIKDQELSPNEPRYVPEYYKERYNPIRRAYKMPLDIAFKPLIPVLVREVKMHSVVLGTSNLPIMARLVRVAMPSRPPNASVRKYVGLVHPAPFIFFVVYMMRF
jgi:NADH dehydrogenase (ubiquinone) 1 beta subcomplex subunit 6